MLYCIKGSKLKDKDIVTEDIEVTSEGKLERNRNWHYSFSYNILRTFLLNSSNIRRQKSPNTRLKKENTTI